MSKTKEQKLLGLQLKAASAVSRKDAVKVLKKKIAGHEFTIANTKAALKSGEHTSFNTSNFFKD